MSRMRNILGTSILSLLLVTWGLFMVCSGRVPEVNYADDYEMFQDDSEESDGIMDQLAMLDEDTSRLEESQRREILEALGIDPNDPDLDNSQEDALLTEELFLDLEVQIAELEKLSQKKNAVLDSLKMELQEADHQLAALGDVVTVPQPQFASTKAIPATTKSVAEPRDRANGHTNGTSNSSTNGELAPVSKARVASVDLKAFYQAALNDVYSGSYQSAITKFTELLYSDHGSDLADNSQYWIGECHFALGNYEQALAEFEKVLAFDVNNKADDAQFMMGMSYLKLGEVELAELEFNSLVSFYEKSEYIARAERKIDDLNI